MGNLVSKVRPGRKGKQEITPEPKADEVEVDETDSQEVMASRGLEGTRQAGTSALKKSQEEKRKKFEAKKAAKKLEGQEDIPYVDESS